MKEKQYILATQDHGAFIGTAEDVTRAWFAAADIDPEDVGFGGNYERYFMDFIIPSQDETHAVYVLDEAAADKLGDQCWHCAEVMA